jgi:hypothetical protein
MHLKVLKVRVFIESHLVWRPVAPLASRTRTCLPSWVWQTGPLKGMSELDPRNPLPGAVQPVPPYIGRRHPRTCRNMFIQYERDLVYWCRPCMNQHKFWIFYFTPLKISLSCRLYFVFGRSWVQIVDHIPAILTMIFNVFPHSFQADVGVVPQITLWLLLPLLSQLFIPKWY